MIPTARYINMVEVVTLMKLPIAMWWTWDLLVFLQDIGLISILPGGYSLVPHSRPFMRPFAEYLEPW